MSALTNDQIAAGAAVLGDNGQPVGRNTAIMVFDAMTGAALPAQVIGGHKPYKFSWSHPSPDLAALSEVAHNAARYAAWRDAMVADDKGFDDRMAAALPADVGVSRRPTADEWDAAIDKAASLPELVAVRVIGDAMEPAPNDRKDSAAATAHPVAADDQVRDQALTNAPGLVKCLRDEKFDQNMQGPCSSGQCQWPNCYDRR